jgi:hypothetical protein
MTEENRCYENAQAERSVNVKLGLDIEEKKGYRVFYYSLPQSLLRCRHPVGARAYPYSATLLFMRGL